MVIFIEVVCRTLAASIIICRVEERKKDFWKKFLIDRISKDALLTKNLS